MVECVLKASVLPCKNNPVSVMDKVSFLQMLAFTVGIPNA